MSSDQLRFYFPRYPLPDPNAPINMDQMYNTEPLQFLATEEEHHNIDTGTQPQLFLYSFDNSLVESLIETIRSNPLVTSIISPEFDPEELEDVKITLSENEFNRLRTFTSAQGGIMCTICQEESRQGVRDLYNRLRCGHCFHTECIKKWLTTQSTKCPECRRDQRFA